MQCYDALVLGVGGVGSAALYHLAQRGARVLGIDMTLPPHGFGSSHGHTRVIRQAYFEHPDYVPLLKESYRGWSELEAASGKQLFHQIGLIEVGPEDGVVVPGVLRAAREHRLAVESLSPAAIQDRWPGLRIGYNAIGVYEPAAGYLLVEDCVEAYLAAALEAGAEFRTAHVAAIPWSGRAQLASQSNDSEITVQLLNESPVRTKRLIVAAGPWTGELLRDLSPKLTVLRKPLYWFKTDSPGYEAANGFPVFLFERAQGIFYGFPKLDSQGVKVAEHTGGQVVESPSLVDRSPDADEQERLMEFLAAHLPGVKKEISGHAVCMYTMSPDEHFLVDRHPQYSNVVFAAGLSGHGFKFVPVLGRALADLALEGGTELPIEFLSLNRFAAL